MNRAASTGSATNLQNKAKAFVEILRPVNCIFGGLTVLIGILNNDPSLVATSTGLLVVGGFIVYFFVAGASNVINDIFDLEIDKINRPERPIPSGRINKVTATRYFLALCCIATGLAIGTGLFTPNAALIPACVVFFLFIGFLYAWKGKASGFPGNLTVGISFSFGMPFGALFVVEAWNIHEKIFFFFATSALLLISREFVKGMEDMEGDKKFNIKTVANTKGTRMASILSVIFSILAIITFTAPAFYLISSLAFIILMILGDIAVIVSIVMLIKDRESKKNQKLSSLALKGGAFLGLVAYTLAPLI